MMNDFLPLLAAVLVACTLLCWVALIAARSRTEADEVARRLSAYMDGQRPAQPERVKTGNPLRDLLDSFTDALNPLVNRGSYAGKLAEDLQKAGLRLKSSEWMLIVAGVGVVVGGIFWLRFGTVFAFIPCPIVIWIGSGVFLRFRQGRRTRAFE
ncbi:MAG TPA: hypothetical protein DCX12_02340, partial [Chloroflexi bacterium]|nr:hypothetical protein [Chloroflexota bacterium]